MFVNKEFMEVAGWSLLEKLILWSRTKWYTVTKKEMDAITANLIKINLQVFRGDFVVNIGLLTRKEIYVHVTVLWCLKVMHEVTWNASKGFKKENIPLVIFKNGRVDSSHELQKYSSFTTWGNDTKLIASTCPMNTRHEEVTNKGSPWSLSMSQPGPPYLLTSIPAIL